MLFEIFRKNASSIRCYVFVTKACIVCRGPVYLSLFPSAVNSHTHTHTHTHTQFAESSHYLGKTFL